VSDELQGNIFLNFTAYSKSQSGEMFFGGSNGFNAFFPDQIVDNPHPPPVFITEFLLANKQALNLTAAMLAGLPPDLLHDLGQTTLVLNMEAILEVIERIEAHAPGTAETLRALEQNFEIDRIREVLGEVG
jgi:hypothetical protein